MVRKQSQSRNLLHFEIFKEWNRLTENKDSERKLFSKEQINSIKKGNKLFTNKYVSELRPNGATLLGLECIYTKSKQDYSTEKIYTREWGSEAMMKAVMETISYHFKPKMFYKYIEEKGKDGKMKKYYTDIIDVEKVIKMVPHVYKKIMYRRFGVLDKEAALGVKDNSLIQDYEETAEEIDEETGEVQQTQYFITNPLNVYAKSGSNEITLLKRANMRVELLKVHTGREAVQYLMGIVSK